MKFWKHGLWKMKGIIERCECGREMERVIVDIDKEGNAIYEWLCPVCDMGMKDEEG